MGLREVVDGSADRAGAHGGEDECVGEVVVAAGFDVRVSAGDGAFAGVALVGGIHRPDGERHFDDVDAFCPQSRDDLPPQPRPVMLAAGAGAVGRSFDDREVAEAGSQAASCHA